MRFTFWCACGEAHDFTDAMRGVIVGCACGGRYIIPERAAPFDRAFAHLRWLWTWWTAGPRSRAQRGPGPYREQSRRISCPRCGDVPLADAEWQCELCLCCWNTFDTRGRCPGCAFRFPATACLACGAMSRHSDWYH